MSSLGRDPAGLKAVCGCYPCKETGQWILCQRRNSAEHRPNAGLAWLSYCRAQYGSGICTYGRVGARRIGWLHDNPLGGRQARPAGIERTGHSQGTSRAITCA